MPTHPGEMAQLQTEEGFKYVSVNEKKRRLDYCDAR